MNVLYSQCAGLDVHKGTVVACVRIASGQHTRRFVESFGSTTKELLRLSDWLTQHGCTHVAMEATGVYWKPVWHVLEASFDLVLANAAHVKNVPGRKTDVNDATWLADLLAHGLIRASFVPETPLQDLRQLLRTRKQLIRQKGQHGQRIEKTLEDANIKVGNAISDVLGVSGRAFLQGLIDGETDPEVLVQHASRKLRASRAELIESLRGHVRPHHRLLLRLHLEQVQHLEQAIAELDLEVGTQLQPFRYAVDLLITIPGVGELLAQTIVSEIGVGMSRFPTAGHLLSWAGLCPRNDESAGKRRTNRLRQGAPWLKTQLVQGAWGAVRTKDTYLRAQFVRLKGRRGPRKAVVAVAASMLTAAYHMLRDGVPYEDLGFDYFDRLNKKRLTARLVHRLETLGYQVDLAEVA